jgi:hypothetical protein
MKVEFLMRADFKRNRYNQGDIVDLGKDEVDVLVDKGFAKKVASKKKAD